jgi:hypothetical protein
MVAGEFNRNIRRRNDAPVILFMKHESGISFDVPLPSVNPDTTPVGRAPNCGSPKCQVGFRFGRNLRFMTRA